MVTNGRFFVSYLISLFDFTPEFRDKLLIVSRSNVLDLLL